MSINLKIRPAVFPHFTHPLGFLDPSRECQALWFYASCAAGNYKDEIEHLRLEGDRTRFNYHNLYTTIASLYGADPNRMCNYWFLVDQQMKQMRLTLLPNENKYRRPHHLHESVRPRKPN